MIGLYEEESRLWSMSGATYMQQLALRKPLASQPASPPYDWARQADFNQPVPAPDYGTAGVVQQENYGGVMGAAMPPSHLDNDFFKQLTQLVDFRERGLLSEVEFDEAKQRLMISSRDV
eukprot:TRINITY_DN9153_c1_g2_i3.p1 TRINITY_DN9153_c1_g2~~TRINITY_DN9153_c1_g2_i3.p1  ORF type:complete len:119 (+),score=23.32 TRINITY_DN9153_c1_g2_i3:210-566(+)